VIVSQYDVYVTDAGLDALLPPILQFAIQSQLVELLSNNAEYSVIFEATQRILIGLQIGELEVKEHLKLSLLSIYYTVI
jgi:hypothetical protein